MTIQSRGPASCDGAEAGPASCDGAEAGPAVEESVREEMDMAMALREPALGALGVLAGELASVDETDVVADGCSRVAP